MRKSKHLSAVWIAALAVGCGELSAQATSTPPSSGEGQPTYRLQTSVRRVYIDVVAVDAHGHPVRGLNRDDFRLYEDGVPQTLRGFDVHEPANRNDARPDLLMELPPNTFTNIVRAPEDGPVTVILYDMLNSPTDAMPYAHEALVNFIKEQKSSSRIAIFVLGERLRMLQGFTDDETSLLRAINSRGARTQQSRHLSVDTTESREQAGIEADLPVGATSILSEMKSMETSEHTAILRDRLGLTVGAFTQIARFVSTLPGRKNLIWLSGSFPSGVMPDSDPAVDGTVSEFGDAYSLSNEVTEMENLLNLSRLVIYPVDVRGLEANPTFSAANASRIGPVQPKATDPFSTQQAAEHGTMNSIAESTGGRAFYNTNGLKAAMQSAMEDGSSYYTLTYAPPNAKDDGRLRHIKVELRDPEYRLEYRRSYVTTRAADAAAAQATVTSPENVFLNAAMQHGATISPELFLEATVYPVGETMPASMREMEDLREFVKTKTTRRSDEPPPLKPIEVQHYEVKYAVLGRQLEIPPVGNSRYATNMTFALAAYSPDGLILNGMEVSAKKQVSEDEYQQIKRDGYRASMFFVVPVEASALRLAARDGIGNCMGTVEVPLPLPPLGSAGTPPLTGAEPK